MHPISTANAEHYRWGDGCDGWHLLRSPTLSVIQERMPPGTAEVRHRHSRAQQLFYVLDGALTIALPDRTLRLGEREAAHVPAGVMHRVTNEGTGDAHFLVISEPPGHGDRSEHPGDD